MKILITGGTGFIGSRLALRCLSQGHEVRIIAQKNTEAEIANCNQIEAEGIEVVNGSITNPDTVKGACKGVEIIHHLAAAQHEAHMPDTHFRSINVEGTRNLLDAAVEAGVRRFVHGSTIGVYGGKANQTVTDNSPLEPDNIYGITKLEAESVLTNYTDNLSLTSIRISETYGPGDRRLIKLFKGIEKGKFFHIGPGRNLHHPVYVENLVDAFCLAATASAPPSEPFVVAGPNAITTNEMVGDIATALDKPAPKLRIPLWPLMTLAHIMEKSLRPLGIQSPIHPRRMSFFLKSFDFTCDLAKNQLGYSPTTDFQTGARRTLEWYRANSLL